MQAGWRRGDFRTPNPCCRRLIPRSYSAPPTVLRAEHPEQSIAELELAAIGGRGMFTTTGSEANLCHTKGEGGMVSVEGVRDQGSTARSQDRLESYIARHANLHEDFILIARQDAEGDVAIITVRDLASGGSTETTTSDGSLPHGGQPTDTARTLGWRPKPTACSAPSRQQAPSRSCPNHLLWIIIERHRTTVIGSPSREQRGARLARLPA